MALFWITKKNVTVNQSIVSQSIHQSYIGNQQSFDEMIIMQSQKRLNSWEKFQKKSLKSKTLWRWQLLCVRVGHIRNAIIPTDKQYRKKILATTQDVERKYPFDSNLNTFFFFAFYKRVTEKKIFDHKSINLQTEKTSRIFEESW